MHLFHLISATSYFWTLCLRTIGPSIDTSTRPTAVHVPGLVMLVSGILVNTYGLKFGHFWALFATVSRLLGLQHLGTFQYLAGLLSAMRGPVVTDTRGTVVWSEFDSIVVESFAHDTLARN